ncbi:hypothetical protein EMIHUDRAFT_433225, partial [Emiliania huxleyi CCMP1516]|uniref:Uncharacterized protein n=2 Tax=Emiliania huxleyi TaxID=2903 RepID=A0A0D3I2L7_EMIH1
PARQWIWPWHQPWQLIWPWHQPWRAGTRYAQAPRGAEPTYSRSEREPSRRRSPQPSAVSRQQPAAGRRQPAAGSRQPAVAVAAAAAAAASELLRRVLPTQCGRAPPSGERACSELGRRARGRTAPVNRQPLNRACERGLGF